MPSDPPNAPSLRYPVLVSDVDGTMVDSKGRLSEASVAAAALYIERGGRIMCATGKLFQSIEPIVERLQLTSPQIVCDGAATACPDTKRTVPRAVLPPASACSISALLGEKGIEHVFYTATRILAEEGAVATSNLLKLTEVGEPEPVIIPRPQPVAEAGPVLKILAFLDRAGDECVADAVSRGVSGLRVIRTSPHVLEFSSRDSGKLKALRCLSRRCGFDLSEVAAIGDNDNDAEMVAHAGFGAAVENASPRTLTGARLVCPSNERDGFASFIQVLLGISR